MTNKVTKAIFPVAGLGTRFLPATKSIPKEIMTLVDRPLIQYAIDEAREAGITEFIFVTARGKSALEDYFDRAPELEAALRLAKKQAQLDELRRTDMDSGAIAYIRQRDPKGLGHAVWCARRLVGDEPFAVILPDDVIAGQTGCLRQMVDAYAETGGNMVAAMKVPPAQISSYGVLAVKSDMGALLPASGMVEKPRAEDAPSDFAAIGRYILRPEVMHTLDSAQAGSGGEIQLTDAIAAQIRDHDNVFGYRFKGQRFDCGSKAGFLQATVAFGLAREDLRDEFGAYLSSLNAASHAAE
ncbi:UTP--glucose-1-phosphate uridylyltransferase [Abyssibius alkaniclasticus]|uniref:UTP--glucose-1-phosphate uridylyltransferase n=1 Tax=Abyssibius alkaniclasticus TaxID=2881234 RepID=UPI002363D45E|nr:UTP--glucose-1-phosphate uridylyltransferase [Abyssibius alkaniclasticus]UPH71919.1 UTP--glucose-1-phosphate uridylyltransferase [Abyssibius alkaniclasticus]